MKKNYSLPPTNPNVFLDRKQALDYLVDECINGSETEWAQCSVRLCGMGRKSKTDALKDIREVAGIVGVDARDDMLLEAFDIINENLL
jgi:hypothetical protein